MPHSDRALEAGMTGAQLALTAGALISLGLVLAVWWLVPAAPTWPTSSNDSHPPTGAATPRPAGRAVTGSKERLGLWALRHLPAGIWGRIPTRELALLRISLPRYYGEKITFALLGLILPSLLTLVVGLSGFQLPVVVPVAASLVLAGVVVVRAEPQRPRRRQEGPPGVPPGLGAYVDLVALERNSGAGPRQAMEVAATVGHSWVFRRVRRTTCLLPLVRPGPLGWDPPPSPTSSASPNSRTWPTFTAAVRGGRRPGVRHPAGPLHGAAYRPAHQRPRQSQPGVRTDGGAQLLGVVFIALLVTPPLLRLLTS